MQGKKGMCKGMRDLPGYLRTLEWSPPQAPVLPHCGIFSTYGFQIYSHCTSPQRYGRTGLHVSRVALGLFFLISSANPFDSSCEYHGSQQPMVWTSLYSIRPLYWTHLLIVGHELGKTSCTSFCQNSAPDHNPLWMAHLLRSSKYCNKCFPVVKALTFSLLGLLRP